MKRYIKQILSTSALVFAAAVIVPSTFAAPKDEVTQKQQSMQQEASNKDRPTSTPQSSQISNPSKKRPRTPNIFPLCSSVLEFLDGYHFQGDTLFSRKDKLLMALPMEKGGKWESYGFRGVKIKNFVKDDNRMLAYNAYWGDGIIEPRFNNFFYYSDDYGKTYIEIHPKVNGKYIKDFPICQIKYISRLNDSGKLIMEIFLYDFAAYRDNEFCVSDDFGQTWTTLSCAMSEKEIMYESPSKNVFAITGIEHDGWRRRCIEVTPDGGKTWNKTIFEISADYFAHLEFNPEDENEIFVNFQGANKFGHSVDCGKTWDVQSWDDKFFKMCPAFQSGVVSDSYHRGRYYKISSSCNEDLEVSTRTLSVSNDYGENWIDLYSETIEEYDPRFSYLIIDACLDYVLLIGSDFTAYRFDVNQNELANIGEIYFEGLDTSWEINDNMLRCNGGVSEIRIYNLNGYEVVNVVDNSADLSSLTPGVYIAIAVDECGNMSNCFKFNR